MFLAVTALIELNAESKLDMEAAKIAAITSPITPVGRYASTNIGTR